MKLTSKIAALAVVGFAALTSSAQALTVANGDLILNIYVTSGQGSTGIYQVDLGSITGFTPTSTLDLSNKVSYADLQVIFGSNLANAQYDVVGTTGPSTNISFSSVPGGTIYSNSAMASSSTTVNGAGQGVGSGYAVADINPAPGSISAFYNSFALTSAYSGNSAVAAFNTGKTSADIAPNGSAFDLPADGSVTSENGLTSLTDLYILNPKNNVAGSSAQGSVTDLGTLGFNGQKFTFTGASAVPEPSTYALMGLGALFLVFALKRRTVAGL